MNYRARIGGFYPVAVKLSALSYPLTDITTVITMLILKYYRLKGLPLALFLNMTFHKSIIELSGDVHKNPGPTENKEISIIHINARSLENKVDLIEVEAKDHDIITLSETWLVNNEEKNRLYKNKLKITGFSDPIRCDRDRGWGGVAIYVRKNLYFRERKDLSVPGLEAVWIETRAAHDKLLVGSFYRPPDSLVSYWDLVDQSIKKAYNTPYKLLILGDFNTDFINNPSNHLINIMDTNNLKQLVREPTRITDNTATCIDIILTPCEEIVSKVSVLPPICSDHMVPCIKIKTNYKPPSAYKKEIYKYSQIDVVKFEELLQNINFEEIVNENTTEKAAELFSDHLLEAAKKCMPIKNITICSTHPPG